MGLFDKRNLDKAKALALKNKDKIADGVHKATDAIDKKTAGKHADKLRKLDDAAAKFAGTADEATADEGTADPTPATTADDTADDTADETESE